MLQGLGWDIQMVFGHYKVPWPRSKSNYQRVKQQLKDMVCSSAPFWQQCQGCRCHTHCHDWRRVTLCLCIWRISGRILPQQQVVFCILPTKTCRQGKSTKMSRGRRNSRQGLFLFCVLPVREKQRCEEKERKIRRPYRRTSIPSGTSLVQN